MRTMIALLGLCLALPVLAESEPFAYTGYTQVTEAEIREAFARKDLSPDQISAAHVSVLSQLYREKGIDFIGVVEHLDELLFTIEEQPYWLREGYEAYIPERMNSLSQLKTVPLLKQLQAKSVCLEVAKTGPDSYTVKELPANQQAGKHILICPISPKPVE